MRLIGHCQVNDGGQTAQGQTGEAVQTAEVQPETVADDNSDQPDDSIRSPNAARRFFVNDDTSLGIVHGYGLGWDREIVYMDPEVSAAMDSRTAPATVTDLPLTPDQLQHRRATLLRVLEFELEALDAQTPVGDFVLTGGSTAYRPTSGPSMVINRNWDAALNLASDPLGLLEPLMGLQGVLNNLSVVQAKEAIDRQRNTLREAGLKNIPGNATYIGADGVVRIDYRQTAKNLEIAYADHVRDQRMRQTWGDNYKNIRLGKSGYSPQQFEEVSLNLQQNVMDKSVRQGLDLLAKGQLELKKGSVMLTLGVYADNQVRQALRTFYASEGLSEAMNSSHVAVNRKITNGLLSGIPDLRLGNNLFSDSTLANKTAETYQIQRWIAIQRSASVVVIRPSFKVFPNYEPGSWVIPPGSVSPATTRNKPSGRFW